VRVVCRKHITVNESVNNLDTKTAGVLRISLSKIDAISLTKFSKFCCLNKSAVKHRSVS